MAVLHNCSVASNSHLIALTDYTKHTTHTDMAQANTDAMSTKEWSSRAALLCSKSWSCHLADRKQQSFHFACMSTPDYLYCHSSTADVPVQVPCCTGCLHHQGRMHMPVAGLGGLRHDSLPCPSGAAWGLLPTALAPPPEPCGPCPA